MRYFKKRQKESWGSYLRGAVLDQQAKGPGFNSQCCNLKVTVSIQLCAYMLLGRLRVEFSFWGTMNACHSVTNHPIYQQLKEVEESTRVLPCWSAPRHPARHT